MNTQVRVAIVVLNWRGWRDTIACLRSLGDLKHDSFCVVVVDNNSGDESVPRISNFLSSGECDLKFQGRITSQASASETPVANQKDCWLIEAEQNGGFAYGNNIGIKFAQALNCRYFWILNNDTEVDEGSLTALEARCTALPNAGMVGSLLCFYDQPNMVQALGGVNYNFKRAIGFQLCEGFDRNSPDLQKLASTNPTYVSGASMFVSAEFLDDVGLMDESNFLYFEEIDWAMRGRSRWSTAIALDSVVLHKEGGSIGTSSRHVRSLLSQYYLTRGLIRFYCKHFPLLMPIAIIRVVKEVADHFIEGNFSHASVSVKAMLAAIAGEKGVRRKPIK